MNEEGGPGEHLGAATKAMALDEEPNRDDRKPRVSVSVVLRAEQPPIGGTFCTLQTSSLSTLASTSTMA